MPASTEVTRLVLRKLAADAVTNGTGLQSTLQAAAFGTVSQALTGKILIEAQSGTTRSRYELPVGAAALQPQEISAMLSRLLDLYDAAIASGLTGGIGAPDAAVLVWMLSQLVIVRSFGVDFSAALQR